MRPGAPLIPGGALRRLTALLVDQVIIGNLWLLLASWTGAVYLWVSRGPGDLRTVALLAGLLGFLGVLLHAVYWIGFVGGCGQTPGKMLLDLVVVRRDGSPAGYGRAASRWIGMGLAALPFGLGFLGVLLTRERRGLHDWLAGTRVVRGCSLEPEGEEPAVPASLGSAGGFGQG